jgi:mannose-6-phosphate isomerase
MRRIEKPWGHELLWAETARYVGKVLHIRAGQRLSLQYHRVKDETLRVESGSIDLLIEGDDGELRTVRMGPGDVHHIAPGRKHRMTAVTDCDVVEVSTTELDDVVRLADDFGREGTSEA